MSSLALAVMLVVGQTEASPVEISANPTVYQPVTITVTGPEASETGEVNPFRHYHFYIETWQEESPTYRPVFLGYFAADGNAAETSATSGNKWRAKLRYQIPGTWQYKIGFLEEGDDPDAEWEPIDVHGLEGEIQVADVSADAKGFYRSGGYQRPPFSGRYLRVPNFVPPWPQTREPTAEDYFLKIGADSPENLLAYADFDGTRAIGGPQPKRDGESSRKGLHTYSPHIQDWKEGDPTWQNGKGKGLIGALNYLASQGVNSIYFLTMNVEGDGQDVWPWTNPDTRDQFDVSKLDQWGIVFDHAAELGIALHVVLTETENESLFEALDGANTSKLGITDTRALYYKEIVSRFGYHPAITWNLGEENGGDGKDGDRFAKGNSTEQRKLFSAFISMMDANSHPVVVHTYPGQYDKIYEPLLGYDFFDGPSLQVGDPKKAHALTLDWIRRSENSTWHWFVCVDEIGPADTGVVPDDAPNAAENHKLAREVLWGNLLAGGGGVEWYFGYKYPHNDLNCEDFRSRERVWKFSKAATDFFYEYLPFAEMESADELGRGDIQSTSANKAASQMKPA